jgi:predicted DNA-binding protein (UPF0251 family)
MRPGRPRCPRRIEREPEVTYFKPRGIPLRQLGVVIIQFEELEAIRLTDIEEMKQEHAAQVMGVSRRAFWEDLQSARRKIAEALVEGKAIRIEGGSYKVESRRHKCQNCENEWEEPYGTGKPIRCPKCGCTNICKDSDDGSHQERVKGHGEFSYEGGGTPKADCS